MIYTGKVPDVVLTLIRVIETTGAQRYGKGIIRESLVRLYRVTSVCDIKVQHQQQRYTEREISVGCTCNIIINNMVKVLEDGRTECGPSVHKSEYIKLYLVCLYLVMVPV